MASPPHHHPAPANQRLVILARRFCIWLYHCVEQLDCSKIAHGWRADWRVGVSLVCDHGHNLLAAVAAIIMRLQDELRPRRRTFFPAQQTPAPLSCQTNAAGVLKLFASGLRWTLTTEPATALSHAIRRRITADLQLTQQLAMRHRCDIDSLDITSSTSHSARQIKNWFSTVAALPALESGKGGTCSIQISGFLAVQLFSVSLGLSP